MIAPACQIGPDAFAPLAPLLLRPLFSLLSLSSVKVHTPGGVPACGGVRGACVHAAGARIGCTKIGGWPRGSPRLPCSTDGPYMGGLGREGWGWEIGVAGYGSGIGG